jgi:protein O-GlcNAc transferase
MLQWLFRSGKKGVPEVSAAGAAEKIGLALQQHQAGRLEQAEALYREVLELDPQNVDALHFLGVIAYQQGRHGQAEELISRSLLRNSANAPAYSNLGNALEAQGKHQEAIDCYRRALALAPDYVDALVNLGATYRAQGELDQAVSCYRRALELKPDVATLHFTLGNVLVEQGRQEIAANCYQRALELRPDFAEAQSNLGTALRDRGRLGEAIACYEKALVLQPGFADGHYNLGNVLKDVGRLDEAVRSYRQALVLAPDHADAHSSMLCAFNYVSGLRQEAVYAEHREYASRFCPPRDPRPHGNVPDAGRKLRIGYVSGDFRKHPVAQFIEPVMSHHDRGRFEVFCYYNNSYSDDTTKRLRSRATGWREVLPLSDAALADRIRGDSIDILVDLSGHTAHHRLPVFARKPAPVQATWLGYLNTTGLETIDYRVTDGRASPEGLHDAFHSERLLRLPDSQWCYRPPPDCPETVAPPAGERGQITFAAFTNLAKIGPPVVELWSQLLKRVATARLLVVGPGLASIREEFLARFARHGVSAERIELREQVPFRQYLAMHGDADVVLDTFPYGGGTTTCHALWMGVPVVSLAGETTSSRSGVSLLGVVGLDKLVARSADEYLEIAEGLAKNPSLLAEWRSSMRARLSESALMDVARFTQNLERAFRTAWESWCEKQ